MTYHNHDKFIGYLGIKQCAKCGAVGYHYHKRLFDGSIQLFVSHRVKVCYP